MANIDFQKILSSAEHGTVNADETVPKTAQVGYLLIKNEKVNHYLFKKVEQIVMELMNLGVSIDDGILNELNEKFMPNLIQMEANKDRLFNTWEIRKEKIGNNKLLVPALKQALQHFEVNSQMVSQDYFQDYTDLNPLNSRITTAYVAGNTDDASAWEERVYTDRLASNFQVSKRENLGLADLESGGLGGFAESLLVAPDGGVKAESDDDNPLIENPLPTLEKPAESAEAVNVKPVDVKPDVVEPEVVEPTGPTAEELAADDAIDNPLPVLDGGQDSSDFTDLIGAPEPVSPGPELPEPELPELTGAPDIDLSQLTPGKPETQETTETPDIDSSELTPDTPKTPETTVQDTAANGPQPEQKLDLEKLLKTPNENGDLPTVYGFGIPEQNKVYDFDAKQQELLDRLNSLKEENKLTDEKIAKVVGETLKQKEKPDPTDWSSILKETKASKM